MKKKLTKKQREGLIKKMLDTEEGRRELSQIFIDEWRRAVENRPSVEERMLEFYKKYS